MPKSELDASLSNILRHYQHNFSEKQYQDAYQDTDILMNAFGLTQALKQENKQFWGRQLGKCWESLVIALCEATCSAYIPAKRFGNEEPCDLFIGSDAIDTKYRVGSGDSGTLKKFKRNAELLLANEYRPVMLIVRENNLPAAMTAVNTGGWDILTGRDSFSYLEQQTGFDLYN